MQIIIPKCLLRGMTLSDLVLLDSTCDVSQFGTDDGSNYIVTIPMVACGTQTQVLQTREELLLNYN